MKENLGRLLSVLLIGLLLIKVSAFHIYEHHDVLEESSTHCELCVLALDGQQTEGIFSSHTIVESSPIAVPEQPKIVFYHQEHANTPIKGILFLRPPPHRLAC